MIGNARRRSDRPGIWALNKTTGKVTIRPRAALLKREPKTAGRITAFDELHRDLAISTEIFINFGDGGRQGTYDATVALVKFLTSQGIPYAALEPIIAIQTAIVDADRGTASEIFAPIRSAKGGKPPDSDTQRAFNGKLATVVECCVEHCRQAGKRPYLELAGRMAAKLINKSHWPVHVTVKELLKIRESIKAGPEGSVERALFDAARNSAAMKCDPLEWAKRLLIEEAANPPTKLSD